MMDVFNSNSKTHRVTGAQGLFEQSPSAMLVMSPELEIVAVSDKYLTITENQRSTLLGKKLDRDFAHCPNQPWISDLGDLVKSVRRVLKSGKRHRFLLRENAWDRVRLPESSQRTWRATTTPVRDTSGKLAFLFHELGRITDSSGTRMVREFARRVIAMQEEDRERISRELHDQMAQYLSAMTLGLESLKTESNPQKLEQGVDHIQDLIAQVSKEIHRLAWNLRPAPIEEVGFRNSLVDCVEELAAHSSLELFFHSNLTTNDRFDSTVETICYRIVQEALANIVKHARAKSAGVIVTRRDQEIHIIVEDDGTGFEVSTQESMTTDHDHIGLRGMRERLALIGGSLQIESSVGSGTSLFARIPLNQSGAL
jgi:signal transduction histidine kinase